MNIEVLLPLLALAAALALVTGAARVELPIRLITGSHHMQAFWYATGNTRSLNLLPVAWLIEDRRWVPESATYLTDRSPHRHRTPGEWNQLCIQCHTTGAKPRRLSSTERYTEVAEFGVSCEACHGPCEGHVEKAGNPLARYAKRRDVKPDGTTVHPARLEEPRRSQICGQCHSINSQSSQAWLESYLRGGYAFRAGELMQPERIVVRGSETNYLAAIAKSDPDFFRDRFWSDGMVRLTGREYNGLIDSPCFDAAEPARRMSCFSCHSMHDAATEGRDPSEWADDQLKPGMRGDLACLQCHGEFAERLTRHTGHAADSEGSRCQNCHMPYTTYGLLKTERSHTINSPSVRESVETGRPNACNLCHLDRTLQWTAEHLEAWHGIGSPPLDEDQRTVSAAVLWLLSGDAGQRAIVADNMGRPAARAASGEGWMGLHLGQTLMDPYPAVRFIAERSLRRLPGFARMDYDYVAPPEELARAGGRVLLLWLEQMKAERGQGGGAGAHKPEQIPPTLVDEAGRLNEAAFRRLVGKRDDGPVNLAE